MAGESRGLAGRGGYGGGGAQDRNGGVGVNTGIVEEGVDVAAGGRGRRKIFVGEGQDRVSRGGVAFVDVDLGGAAGDEGL